MILKEIAMEFVAARLRHDVNDRSGVASILRGKIIGDDLVFRHLALVVNEQRGAANTQIVIVRAVNLKVIRSTAISVDREARAVR